MRTIIVVANVERRRKQGFKLFRPSPYGETLESFESLCGCSRTELASIEE
jgi:hypothetical protein